MPADLGYYDLRLPETRDAQAALAREHGIHGFCYYHYWFNGRRLLERPFNEVLNSGSPDFPFCLCWANENWTRAWDGLEREVLIGQRYCPEDDLAHIRWLARRLPRPALHSRPRQAALSRLSRGQPARSDADRFHLARGGAAAGHRRIVPCARWNHASAAAKSMNPPAQMGFDAAVEFQPDGLLFPKPTRPLNDYGGIFDYRAVVERMLQKPDADYLRFPCVTPGWDNSARRKENPTIITGSTPELVRAMA